MNRIDLRLRDLNAAAASLRAAQAIVELAATALAEACPRSLTYAFTRDARSFAATMDRTTLVREAFARPRKSPFIVDIDNVPTWQRDHWVEPIAAGVHGHDYFAPDHPVAHFFAEPGPDYGRTMVCSGKRMVGWIGAHVPAERGFTAAERARLQRVCAQIVAPLRLAAELEGASPPLLTPRQRHLMERVALGWTNKRIAFDLDIAPATVKTLLERLFRRFGVANRTALVARWLEVGPGGAE
jgi:DNA-binding CsgD family transcriptional regulator